MNSTIQPGMHPDAESLTAFAEQLLPAKEREQILAHMATCGRCREVVFLAQKAAGEDERGVVPAFARQPSGPGRRWFAGWRWTWVPVAAMAGVMGVAVVLHFHHAEQPQMATKLGTPSDLRSAVPVEAAPTSSALPEPAQQNKEKAPTPQKIAPREIEKDAARLSDEKEQVEGRDEALGIAGAPPGAIGGIAAGSTHGMTTARAKGKSLGGPMANQFQQNAQLDQQNLTQENSVQAPRNAPALSANKPVTANASPGASAQAATVQVQAEPLQTAPAPAPPMTLSLAQNETVEVNSRQVAGMKKLAKIALPSGAGVLSSASASGRTIALDTAGALFVREDNQKHWQPVEAQWTGRAVLVRTRQVPAASDGALGIVQAPRFELVTDKLQTWVSTDGKTWTAEPILAK
jgi:hypothetical protein